MLVVISDLHFEEEKSRNIPGDGVHEPIRAPRNIHLKAFTKVFGRLAEQARRDKAKRMDLVLAGDIFELHRTALWFRGNPHHVRPYVNAADVDKNLEAKLLEILQAINAPDDSAWDVLAAFRRLNQDGTFLDVNGKEQEFPVPVKVHYLPGNHDRLADSTPAIRRTIRQFLGLPSSAAPFRRALTFHEERTLIRHGHEYDPLNFSLDCRQGEVVPLSLPRQAYGEATIGDFVTAEVASGIGEIYREYHQDERIVRDPLLRRVYERILEVDDLRPLHAIPNFLLYLPDSGYTPEQIWHDAVKPVAQILLENIHQHPFLVSCLDKMDQRNWPDLVDVVQGALSHHVWDWQIWDRNLLSLEVVQLFSEKLIGLHRGAPGPEVLAAREESVLEGNTLFVVCGHTHTPSVKLVGKQPAGEQYYVDTGTWRQQIPAAPGYARFGRVKALTYAVIYGPHEDLGRPPQVGKVASLDYWSGVTQRWCR
jgi:UDP-2,3-diacylglucosamine pyrophosphatase LpxH